MDRGTVVHYAGGASGRLTLLAPQVPHTTQEEGTWGHRERQAPRDHGRPMVASVAWRVNTVGFHAHRSKGCGDAV